MDDLENTEEGEELLSPKVEPHVFIDIADGLDDPPEWAQPVSEPTNPWWHVNVASLTHIFCPLFGYSLAASSLSDASHHLRI
jgi:hypothetical protein